jgi:hypothetical protein
MKSGAHTGDGSGSKSPLAMMMMMGWPMKCYPGAAVTTRNNKIEENRLAVKKIAD